MAITYNGGTNIKYGPVFGMDADLWQGTNVSGSPQALIIYVHGGGWSRGDKSLIETGFDFFTNENGSADQQTVDGLVERDSDIAVATINYPMQNTDAEAGNGSDLPAYYRPPSHRTYMNWSIKAIHQAIRFFRRNKATYNLSGEIILAGSSAGGHNSAAAAFMSVPSTTLLDVGSTRLDPEDTDVAADGLILHQAPLDISLTPGGLYNAFTGYQGNFATDLELIERVKRASALRLMDNTTAAFPVFSWYDNTYDPAFDPADDLDDLNGAHDPYWGVTLHNKIASSRSVDHRLYVHREVTGGALAANTGSWASLHDPLNQATPAQAVWPTDELVSWLTANGWL